MKITEGGNGFAMYLNEQVQSHHVFDYLLDKYGRADKMIISSFAITEAYVRRIIRNRYRIGSIELILDFTIASRNPRVNLFASHNVDRLYLVNNHSKLIYLEQGGARCLAIMSNNATNNHRNESGLICEDPFVIGFFSAELERIKANAVQYGK